MQYQQIIGQHALRQHLLHDINADRVSHAQLFLAHEGSGGLPLALAYIQYLYCQNRQPADSCGSCPACIKSQKMIHPDIHYSFPTVGSKAKSSDFLSSWREFVPQNPYLSAYDWLQHLKAENKQGNITAEECADIFRKLSLKSFEGGYKTLLMWLPEYLGKEGNRLLKLLEEPPDNTLFILVAENPALILSTILSRTQIVKIPRLADEEIATTLQNRYAMPAETAQTLAALAEGNLHAAMQLAENTAADHRRLLLSWLQSCLSQQGSAMLAITEQLAALGREEQKNFLQYVLYFVRKILMYQSIPNYSGGLSEQEQLLGKQLLQYLDMWAVQHLTDALSNAYTHIERNANPRILFFNLSLTLADAAANRHFLQNN